VKVDRNRANEIARDRVYRRSVDSEVAEAILIGVREQTEWLMEEVCLHCGRKKLDHPLPDFDDGSCPCNKTGWYSVDLVTRAEYLHRRGEKP